MLIVNKIFRVTVLLLIYFYHQFVPALKKTLRQLMTYSLIQEDKPQTHRIVSYGVFTRCDRRGDRSRDRSPRRSPLINTVLDIMGDGHSSVVCIPDYL